MKNLIIINYKINGNAYEQNFLNFVDMAKIKDFEVQKIELSLKLFMIHEY